MSYADLNRRLNAMAERIPNDCPECRDQPAIVILFDADPFPLRVCVVCGRDIPEPVIVRFGSRADGPQ